jgi:hypothetical protein
MGVGDAFFQLVKQEFDGCWRIPWESHALFVFVQLSLGDDAVRGFQVSDHGEGGHVSISYDGMFEGANVEVGEGGNDLIAECLVDVRRDTAETLFAGRCAGG